MMAPMVLLRWLADDTLAEVGLPPGRAEVGRAEVGLFPDDDDGGLAKAEPSLRRLCKPPPSPSSAITARSSAVSMPPAGPAATGTSCKGAKWAALISSSSCSFSGATSGSTAGDSAASLTSSCIISHRANAASDPSSPPSGCCERPSGDLGSSLSLAPGPPGRLVARV